MRKNEKQLKEIRKKIDHLDSELLILLEKRLELALMTRKLKKKTHDPSREKELLEGLKLKAKKLALLDPDFLEKFFRLNIDESKKIQNEGLKLIGFQGDYGSYSDVAARSFSKDIIPIAHDNFSELLENFNKDYMDFIIVPVEDSMTGSITELNELLIGTELSIVSEIKLLIRYFLLAVPGVKYSDLNSVSSDYIAFNQCKNFISKAKLELIPSCSSASAAKLLAERREKKLAVIASKRSADIYDLDILKKHIEDRKNNFTRFLVLSKKTSPSLKASKCSIAFSLVDRAGSLFNLLKLFAEEKINLSRIESLPGLDEPGSYWFFVDFIADVSEKRVKKLLERVKKAASRYKFLGAYESTEKES